MRVPTDLDWVAARVAGLVVVARVFVVMRAIAGANWGASTGFPTALVSKASSSPATAAAPQGLVSFINVRVSNGIRQNRCQEAESSTSQHGESKPKR